MLDISLFGTPLIRLDGVPVDGFVSQKALALLAYLAVEMEQAHARIRLAETFWPDQPEKVALKNLRDILFNLQKLLGNQTAQPPYLWITRQTVQFNPHSAYRLDTRHFNALLAACERHPHKKRAACRSCAQRREQAVEFYRGVFLTGVNVGDSAVFEHWLTLERERLQQSALEALNDLTQFHARQRAFEQARAYALQQVVLAPWLESAYRQLMALSALMGQRAAALIHFETCRRRLLQELDVPPSAETLALYQQIKLGQPITAPSLPVAVLPRHNIPAQTTTFLGRAKEQLEIADYLQDPECRLLTLVGPGGCGKTRLAVQSAVSELVNFRHGVFFVSLTRAETTTCLPLILAESIHLPLSGQKSPQEQLLNYLRAKETLLILDNFETLLGNECEENTLKLLVEILRRAPQVVMLVTSRQPVGLQAERIYNLKGLPYPDGETQTDIEQYEAVQVYSERARRVQPDTIFDAENLPIVADICRLLQGLPLGLELAAALARQMTHHEILMAVKASLDALTTSRLDVPARHRSIRATFTSSWATLTLEEQHAFAALAVFRGGFTATAAAAVASVAPQILSSLVDKSLLNRAENDRYQMHELLRQFGEEKLAADPRVEKEVRAAHCDWVVDFLQKVETQLKGKQQLETLDGIQAEIENVRSGWYWAIAQNAENEITRMTPAIAQFFDLRGWFQEGAEMFSRAAAALPDSGALTGHLLVYRGAFTYRMGDYDLAQNLFQNGLAALQQAGAAHQTAFAHNGLAAIAVNRGQYDLAKQQANQGLEIALQNDDLYEQAKSHDIFGITARYEGRLAESNTYFHASQQLYQQLGNKFGLVRCLNYLGNTAMAEGQYQEAQSLFTQAMEISQAIDYRFLTAYLYNNLGGTAGYLKQHRMAKKYFEESLRTFHDLGDQFGVGLAQNNLGEINLLLDDLAEARKYFRDALQIGLDMNSMALVMGSLNGMATLSAQTGQKTLALELAAFIVKHPATREETKKDAQVLLDELSAAVSARQAAAAKSRGKRATLADLTDKLLA